MRSGTRFNVVDEFSRLVVHPTNVRVTLQGGRVGERIATAADIGQMNQCGLAQLFQLVATELLQFEVYTVPLRVVSLVHDRDNNHHHYLLEPT